MTKDYFLSCWRRTGLSALATLALSLQAPLASAQGLAAGRSTEALVGEVQEVTLPLEQGARVNYDSYILGPGDGLQIELLDLPELSGRFVIGPDGALYLPRLRALYVEGLTVEELRTLLTLKFSTFVRDPQVYIRPVGYRPIRVYVGGEVKRPGYYTLTGVQSIFVNDNEVPQEQFDPEFISSKEKSSLTTIASKSSTFALFPTVFDAIRVAQGITPYTDLSQVEVIRKRAEGLGGGRIRTNLNFLSLITEGDESQNIRLFDGDTLKIGKSPKVLRDQILKAGQSNLSPQFIDVFVTGRVNLPGGVKLPQGSSLNQALSLAGGVKLLRGRVEFVRFSREGVVDRRMFAYKPGAPADTANNPVLAAGDLIRVNDSVLSGSIGLLNELTAPMVGIYSAYSLFDNISQ